MTKKKVTEEWFTAKWRPAMAWMYLSVCIFDFVIGPFFYAWFAWYTKDFADFGQWKPLTLEGGGLFHVAMGAVLGVTAWGRTQEKLYGISPTSMIQPIQYHDNVRSYDRPEYVNSQQRTVRGRPIPKTDYPLI
jgi:hypothetical protein